MKLLGQPNLRSGVDSNTRGDATPYDDRPVSLYNALADAAASTAHKARFAQPVDAVGTAAAVVRARAVSAAHVPSDAITIVRPQGQHRVWKRAADATTGLHFHSRARHDGDFEWHAAADDSTCVSAGKVNNPKYDLRFAADRDRIGCETNAEAYDYMHARWQLVQPGRARLAYLQEARRMAPRPLAHAAARTRARTFQRQSIRDVAEADVCMKFAVQLGLIPHDQDSEYRNFQTLCMNPPAFAESDEYQALVCGGLRHALMSGHAATRVSHGAHATRYTPRSCGTLYRIHWAAARKRRAEARANGRRRQGTAHPAPLSGPPTPGRAIPLSCGSADSALAGTQPVAARGATDSAFGSTQTAAAHTVHSSTLARGVWRRSDASHALGTAAMKTAVYVVQRASGLLHFGLTADSSIASGFIDVPYSAEGRREVRAAASRLVTEYGPNHTTSTFYRGRRVPARRPPTVRCRGDHGRTR